MYHLFLASIKLNSIGLNVNEWLILEHDILICALLFEETEEIDVYSNQTSDVCDVNVV